MPLFARLRRKQGAPRPQPPAASPTPTQLVARGDRAAALACGPDGVQAVVAELDGLRELESIRVRGRLPHLTAPEVEPAVRALAGAHDPAASAALARAVSSAVDADAPLTVALLDGLVSDGSDTATSALVTAALHGWDDVAARAAGLLVDASPAAVTDVVAGLSDPDPQVRARAAALLARLAPPDAVALLAPLLRDGSSEVRERVAGVLGELGAQEAVLPLLVAEETERETVRSGESAVTWTGRLSPYLVAVGQVVTGDPGLPWELAQQLPYDAEARLQHLVAEAAAGRAEDVAAAVAGIPVPTSGPWRAADLAALLTGGSVQASGSELRYLEARQFVTDRSRCRSLGLELTEGEGDSHGTVYGEKTDWEATVTCADGSVRLVVDRDDLRRVEARTS